MLKTEGIVLKEMRYKDTSKILSIYTKKHGKITAMARGAYRPKSQIIANTQPFSYNEYQLYKGKNFYYINQADIIDSFYSIREKIERVVYGQYMLELIEKSMEEGQENPKIFMLLLKGLKLLSGMDKDFLKFITIYELKFISFLGYRPLLDRCVLCGNKNVKNIRYSPKEGGIICYNCSSYDSSSIYLDDNLYRGINELLYIPLDRIHKVKLPDETIKKIHYIIVQHILYNIDRNKLNTLNFIKALEST